MMTHLHPELGAWSGQHGPVEEELGTGRQGKASPQQTRCEQGGQRWLAGGGEESMGEGRQLRQLRASVNLGHPELGASIYLYARNIVLEKLGN
jgi:hypothetical protein